MFINLSFHKIKINKARQEIDEMRNEEEDLISATLRDTIRKTNKQDQRFKHVIQVRI